MPSKQGWKFRALAVVCVFALGGLVAFLAHRVLNRPATASTPQSGTGDVRPDVALPAETTGWNNVVEQLLSAFDRVDVVAIGETHGSKASSDLRLRLIRHPDFPKKVRVIVVEFGNSLYQPILDRYLNGDDVPLTEVEQVWTKTTQSAWVSPVYAEFYAAVRQVNRELPPDKRLRVIAGDPPIDWRKVRTKEDIRPFLNQRSFPVSLNRIAVGRGEKALVIYGNAHLNRPRFPLWAAADEAATITHESDAVPKSAPATFKALQVSNPGRIFIVITSAGLDPIEATLQSAERPVLISLIGTPAGKLQNPFSRVTLGDRFDACIYFGKTAEATAIVQ